MADFGYVENENESSSIDVPSPEGKSFEDKSMLERAIKGPTGALESYGRGAANIVTGTLGQGLGSLYGLAKSGGDLGEAVKTGEDVAQNLHINPKQQTSAYFDKQIAEGVSFAREWLGNKATSAKKYQKLDGQTLDSLKDEAANRGIAEGVFDNVILPAILGRTLPRFGGKESVKPKAEEPIKPGPTGEQQEFGYAEEGAQGENATPQTMMDQQNQSPYNIPKSDIERLNEELNPPTEERDNEQGELFTDYNPVDKFKIEETQGGGRFRAPDMDQQVTHDMESNKGLGGATEQSNLSADLFGPKPETPIKPLSFRGPKNQRGVMDLDLLTFGVGHLLQSEGFKRTMEKFKGTFGEHEVLRAIRESNDPDSKTTVVFMSPDKFHELAMKRDATEKYMEGKRQPIREGLKSEKGLDTIPELYLSQEPEGTSVFAHEGRHRMDVFKEQGMDLIPVRVHHNSLTWGRAAKAGGRIPKEVVSENGVRTDFPHPENWKPERDLDFSQLPLSNKGSISRQRGAVNFEGFKLWGGEKETIKAAQEGDSKAFETLFKDNYKRLVKIAKRIVKDEDVAHDVVQDTMISAHEHLNNFEGKSKFSTWLYRIAVNKAKNQLQSRNLKGGVELSDEQLERFEPRHEDTPENIMQGKERAEGINAGWDRLNEDQKLILEMREIEGMDYQKIADLLQIPMGSVKSRIARAREDLAKNISSRGLGQTNIGKSQRGMVDFSAFKLWGKEVDKSVDNKGLVDTLLDARKQFQMMREPLKNYIQGLKPEGIEDFSRSFKIGTNALIDRSASILSETKGVVGKIVKWTVDQLDEIDRKSGLALEKDLFGEKYKEGGKSIFQPLEKRVRGEEGALTLWKDSHKTKEGRLELAEMKEKAVENIGVRTLGPNDFKTDRQFKIYDALQKNFERKRQEINEARAKTDPPLSPIQRIEGYLPASWEGDYRIHIYDGLGNHKQSFGFKTRFQANRAFKAFKEEHPDMDVHPVESVSIDKGQVGDLSAFDAALGALESDDPVAKALQATMVKLRSSKGFGRHGLQRKGVLGFLGMEKGDVGVRNMERSIEQWFRQANRYTSNLEKANVQKQLNAIPLDVQKKIPRALDFLNTYVEQSRGADIDQVPLVKSMLGALSDWVGTGVNGPRNFIKSMSSTSSLYYLTTARFSISQMVQHQNAVAKYVQLLHEGSMEAPLGNWTKNIPLLGKLANAEFIAYKGFDQFVKPDEKAVQGAQWAAKSGKLDSSLVAMLEMKLGDITHERTGLIKDAVSVGMGKLEKNMVRLPTFFSFEHGLRDSIPNDALRYETAAGMMDYYMVHYGSTSAPIMYGKMGILGDAAKPFKQYSHNAWGQFFEYLSYAQRKGGSIEPLLTHVGMQTAIGGLKGTVLVSEVAAFAAVANMMLPADKQLPNVQDLLMNSNLHDLLVFGGLSYALGSDVSSSVNAPNVPQMFSAPGVEFTGKAVKESWNYLSKLLNGTATKDDAYKAALADSPSAMHGWVEELFSTPGQPVPRPGQKMKGNIVRTPKEKLKAELFSVKSLREARANAVISAAKRNLAQDMNAKTSELDAIVDNVEQGKGVDSDLVQRYVKNGGDATKLSDNIIKRMQQRRMDFATRETYNKQLTPAQIHKLDVLKDMLNQQHQHNKEFGTPEGK